MLKLPLLYLMHSSVAGMKNSAAITYDLKQLLTNTSSEEWRPYIQTPPFPSYTSGHATTSAAAAEVMTHWFGDKLSFTDTSSLEFGIESRRIVSFREAAKEAAMSRLYGGIHYRFDNIEGNIYGKKLGEFVVQRLKLKKQNLTDNQITIYETLLYNSCNCIYFLYK